MRYRTTSVFLWHSNIWAFCCILLLSRQLFLPQKIYLSTKNKVLPTPIISVLMGKCSFSIIIHGVDPHWNKASCTCVYMRHSTWHLTFSCESYTTANFISICVIYVYIVNYLRKTLYVFYYCFVWGSFYHLWPDLRK